MNKIFRTLWNPALATWVATPETSRGHARSSSSTRAERCAGAVAVAVALLSAGPAMAAGGAGGQPAGDPLLHAGAGGSDGNGGSGGLNDSNLGASGGNGGASTPAGASDGSSADIGSFAGATPGTGGAAGATSNLVGPGSFRGDDGMAGQSQTGGAGAGNGYGGGGGAGFQGGTIPSNASSSNRRRTGGNGGAGGQGYWAAGGGGAGGYGAILDGPLGNFTSFGESVGGAGGAGGDAFSQAGGGGSGGGGFHLNAVTPGLAFTNMCTITGGAGGAGGSSLLPGELNASGGGGGAGGIGLTLVGTSIAANNPGTITGGAGGAGGNGGGGATGTGAPGAGGSGGAGVSSTGSSAAIANTGTITGGAGGAGGVANNGGANGGANGASGAGGVGVWGSNLDVTNTGTISGGLGGDGTTRAPAVQFTAGSNTLTLNPGGVLIGAIAIDPGATGRVIAGDDGLSVPNALILGGTGTIDTNGHDLAWTGVISGPSDLVKAGAGVLTVSGANTNSGATSVATGTLRAGVAGTFSSASAFNVAAGATLDLAGHNQTIASMNNSGTVTLPGSVAGTTLTVTGPWVGNGGTLRLGTVLGNSASVSDRLILSGATAIASGTTNVQITNMGGLGALTTGSGIEVISAISGATTTAQTTRSAFVLAGGHVDAGAYEYRLYAADASGAGENWYLRSTTTVTPPGGGTGTGTGTDPGTGTGTGTRTAGEVTGAAGTGAGAAVGGIVVPTYRAEVPLYAALPEQFRQANLAMVGNLHQRVGDDGPTGANIATPDQGYRQAWGRVISIDRTISQGGTVSPTSDGRLTGFQAGTDLWADPNWRVGVYVGQLDGDMRVTGFASGVQNLAVGTNNLRNQYLGAYATWKNDGGLYVDSVLQAGRHRYTVSPALGSGSSGKGDSLLASVEVGQAFAIAPNWTVEPQLQLVHQRVSLDDNGIAGALVQQNTHSGWLVRAGVRVKGEMATGAGLLQPYVRFNVYRSGSGTDVARFVGPAAYTDIATRTGGTSTELAGGATLQLTESTSLYGEVGKLWASGGDTRTKGSVQASVGVKVRW